MVVSHPHVVPYINGFINFLVETFFNIHVLCVSKVFLHTMKVNEVQNNIGHQTTDFHCMETVAKTKRKKKIVIQTGTT